jgi:hypothetical protein
MGRNSGNRENKKTENKLLTQINADEMKRAKPMPHFKIYRRER